MSLIERHSAPGASLSDSISLRDRYVGALVGLACGDAVGTAVEFRSRGTFRPVTDMVGGGPFNLWPGQWTDDTSMALCLAESLLECAAFDADDQMQRYVRWRREGYLSVNGRCFDVGRTVDQALTRYQQSGNPAAGSTDRRSAGNGSLMRLAPVVLFAYPDFELIAGLSGESSRTTHGATEAVESCCLFGTLIARALSGLSKDAVCLDPSNLNLTEPAVLEVARGDYLAKNRGQIRGSGYCVESLEAALWCFQSTTTFEGAVLEAANLGDDADTTAAIVGQLAGAYYGALAIPAHWVERLYWRTGIVRYAERLLEVAGQQFNITD